MNSEAVINPFIVEIAILQRNEQKTTQIVHTGNDVDVFVKAVQATMEA